MDYEEKLKRIDRHLAEHPNDYQTQIARLKTYSDAIEHKYYLKRIERAKIIAECKRIYG